VLDEEHAAMTAAAKTAPNALRLPFRIKPRA
jgi:hypothetical protein